MSVAYEWTVETVDEHDDVIDSDAHDTAAGAVRAMRSRTPEPGTSFVLVLVRQRGDNAAGLLDRQWAYVDDDALPETFDGGAHIPAQMRNELAYALAARGQS